MQSGCEKKRRQLLLPRTTEEIEAIMAGEKRA